MNIRSLLRWRSDAGGIRSSASRALGLAIAIGGFAVPAEASATNLDAPALGAHLDGLVPALMRERHLPGAVVVAVQDGAILLARGYGVADLKTGRPIDPETTLFRVASVSKLFTATALMQLVEDGRIDLDDDVAPWVPAVPLASSFGDPVRVWNLLTHTGGFDDAFLGSSQRLEDAPVALANQLAGHMPSRVMPPGRWISYSNYGVALVGHLVERASGEAFGEWVRRRIFEPLGMRRSGFGLPAPPPPELAQGYEWTGRAYRAEPPDRSRIGPAGDLYTTGTDIARFMIAHLQRGQIDGVRILRPETADRMQAQRFTHHPRLDGWCLGFHERHLGGVRTIGHGGSWRGFGTELVLVPEHGFGLFVSTTRAHDARFFDGVSKSVFERFFPVSGPRDDADARTFSLERAELARYEGRWLPSRHVRHDVLKLGLLSAEVVTAVDGEGTLVVHLPELDPMRLRPLEPDVFAVIGSNRRVAFREDANGRPSQMFTDGWAFDRAGVADSPRTHQIAGALCVLVLAGTLVGFALGGASRAIAGGPASSLPLAVRVMACVVAALDLSVLGGVAIGLSLLSPFELFLHVPAWLVMLGFVPFASVPLSLLVAWPLVRSAGRRAWTPLARLHLVLLVLAFGVFGWLVVHWRVVAIAVSA